MYPLTSHVPISKGCLSMIPHRSCNWSDPSRPSSQNYKYVWIYCVSHACYLPHPIYPWFYQPWWRVKTTNVLMTTHYVPSHYFLPHRCNVLQPAIHPICKACMSKWTVISGKYWLKNHPSTKSSSEVSSFLLTTTINTFLFRALPLVWKFSNKALLLTLTGLAYISCM